MFRGENMNKQQLNELKEKIGKLSELEKKQRDLYLRKITTGELQGPPVGYPSIDKPWLKNYSEDGILSDIPKKTIYRYMKESNIGHEKETALEVFGFKIPFKNFFENVDKAANAFKALGIKKGDVVTICSPTFPETIYANYGLMKIGAIANNIDPRNNAIGIMEDINKTESQYLIVLDIAYPKIQKIINDTSVKNVICVSYLDSIPFFAKGIFKKGLEQKLSKQGLEIPKIKYGDYYLTWNQFLKKGIGTNAEEVPYEANMPVAMVRTGGTTGTPKSVVLTNESGLALVEQYKYTDLGLQRGQSLLNIMPEFIAYGWAFGVVMAPCMGIKNTIISQYNQEEFADNIKKYKPNHLVGVPTHYIALMNDPKMEDIDLSKFLKSISAGGDKFHIESERKFNEFLHNHGFMNNVIVGFGLTERSSSVATRLNNCNVLGSTGVPLVKNNISIFQFPEKEEEYGTDTELGYNQYGEICISGPSSMLGYYKNSNETNKIQLCHDDGTMWTHTKDRGYIDENGVIFISGRTKNMIIRPDGHNVWPLEMENAILNHNKVKDCCVIGIPNGESKQGEFPHAVVVLKEEYTNDELKIIEKEIREICATLLPERDVPYSYSFEKSLPLTDIGKIDTIKVKKRALEKE